MVLEPNLSFTHPFMLYFYPHVEKILRTTLSIYMEGESVGNPLPTLEEVLVCNQHTTAEEVLLEIYMSSLIEMNNFFLSR